MQVETYLFGKVDVAQERIITFPQGLVGFDHLHRFMLVHEAERGEPASFTLQSVDEPALAFQIIDPTVIGFHYELALSEAETAVLQSPTPDDIAVMLILFRQDGDGTSISANLRAPILINTRDRVGLQKVMEKLQPNITLTNLAAAI